MLKTYIYTPNFRTQVTIALFSIFTAALACLMYYIACTNDQELIICLSSRYFPLVHLSINQTSMFYSILGLLITLIFIGSIYCIINTTINPKKVIVNEQGITVPSIALYANNTTSILFKDITSLSIEQVAYINMLVIEHPDGVSKIRLDCLSEEETQELYSYLLASLKEDSLSTE